MLYPLKFNPILKEALWGGSKLTELGKHPQKGQNAQLIGESWELSSVTEDESVICNGALRSNTLSEAIEVYIDALVGEKVYDKYGLELPVLLKFIAPNDQLSLQVHPNDEFADEFHGQRGKWEMWYVVDAQPDSYILLDWQRPLSEEEFDHLTDHHPSEIEHLVNRIPVSRGDAFLIPPGTIHSLGKGVVIAEIQESSTLTYRIYDWERRDKNGFPRELHTAYAAEVIRLAPQQGLNITKQPQQNEFVELSNCDKFRVRLLGVDGRVEVDYAPLDSFVAYMCTAGQVEVGYSGGCESLSAMETLLVPAEATEVYIKGCGTLLEITIP